MTYADWQKVMEELIELRKHIIDDERLSELRELEILWMERMPTDCRGGQCG